jgi:hypothetical protein
VEEQPPGFDSATVPRLAFLGFCDRLADIRKGHPLLWHKNLLGLSVVRASHVFPLNLKDQKLVIALYKPCVGENFKLQFRGGGNLQPFEIDLSIAGMTQHVSGENSAITEVAAAVGSVVPGWVLIANEISTDVMVNEPGDYHVFLCSAGSEEYVGTVVLAHAAVPPFGADEIAAIKSNPLGVKHARMKISCKFCGDSMQAYTGIERVDRLEKDGWQWSQEIREERFACSCGKTSFSLIPIRTGLHGLLRRNLNPSTNPVVSTIRQYEQSALEESCRRFMELIGSNPREEDVQNFLEANTIFFYPFLPEKLMFKKPVLTKYFVDFAVLNNRQELLLIEIEKPGLRLLKKDGGITAGLEHGLDQVRHWIQVFNDQRVAALDAFNLKIEEVAKVRGIVIAGRKPTDENHARLLRSISWGEIEVLTFDDILRGVTDIIKHVANV